MTSAGVTAANIARWDGANWHAMGAGLNARVNTIALTPTATSEFVTAQDSNIIAATVVADSISSTVSWRRSPSAIPPRPLRWLVGPTETAQASASLRAAYSIGVPPASASRDSVTFIFPTAPERATLRARATALHAAWMIGPIGGKQQRQRVGRKRRMLTCSWYTMIP